MNILVYGELQIYPRIETFAPFLPAVSRASVINLILLFLSGVHLVCNRANLNFFIYVCISLDMKLWIYLNFRFIYIIDFSIVDLSIVDFLL